MLLRELNIFATTKANQRAILEQLKQLAISNNTSGASIFDLGNIIKSDSIAEVSHILKKTEQKAEMMRQQEMQQAQQMQEQALQAQAQQEQAKRDFEASENEKDRQKDLLEAQIRAAGYGAMQDINANAQSDYLDFLDKMKKSEEYQQAIDVDIMKENNRTMQAREKNAIEKEKLQTQKDIAATQLQIAKENKNKYDVAKKNKENEKKPKK